MIKKNNVLANNDLFTNRRNHWQNSNFFLNNLPSQKQWKNSVYIFNKNYLANIPQYDKLVKRLSNGFYNMFGLNLEKKILSQKYYLLNTRFKRLSLNRILVSKPEIKHYTDKVLLTFYTHNRQKTRLLARISKLRLMHNKINKQRKIQNNSLVNKLMYLSLVENQFINWKLLNYCGVNRSIFANSTFEKIINLFNKTVNKEKYLYINLEKCLKKLLKKEVINNYYKLLLYINKSKFNEVYLTRLAALLTNVYNKKIEFNIINLKYIYLNSDILSQAAVLKLKNRGNRATRVLRNLLNLVKIPKINKVKLTKNESIGNNAAYLLKQNLTVVPDKLKRSVFIAKKIKQINIAKRKQLLSLTGYKTVTGVRVEASGRLTKRLTAARAISKFKYKGSLKHIHSSYKGLSSEMLRNQLKGNIDYTQINSKTRNGAFGIKGWIAHI